MPTCGTGLGGMLNRESVTMGEVHPFIASSARRSRPQALVAVVCAYACTPGAGTDAAASWTRVLELARAGFDVWVVTTSEHRDDIERVMASPDTAGVQVLFWDASPALRLLRRWPQGLRLHRGLWYWIVARAIAQWHAAVGMAVVRRVAQGSGASITYLLLPAVQRTARARFALRPLRD